MSQLPENITVSNGGVRLAVRLYARPGAETVVLLHGGPGVPDEMTEVRELLAEHLQVITFDQRGTGSSRCSSCTFSLSDYISDINCIAEHLQLERFHLFGHSWGGLYAQLFAREFPHRVASLFLCSPASGTGNTWELAEKEVLRYIRRRATLTEWIIMGFHAFHAWLGSNRAHRRLFRMIILNYHKGYAVPPPDPEKLARISGRAARLTRAEIRRYPPLSPWESTPFSVIITYGQEDAYGPSRQVVFDRFPEAMRVIVPRCGHTPWKHNLPAFAGILQGFYRISPYNGSSDREHQLSSAP